MGANAVTTVPVYVSGEVLTAADLNITNSGVPVFATTVTRDAAFGGAGEKVLAQGQTCYLESTSKMQTYTGSAWEDLIPGAWISFTPTLSGWTQGNGTFTAAYQQIGKLVNVRGVFVGGSTTVQASFFDMTFPVAANGFYDTYKQPLASGNYYDTSAGANYTLQALWISTTIRFGPIATSGSWAQSLNLASPNPVAYATGDFISFSYSYEAA